MKPGIRFALLAALLVVMLASVGCGGKSDEEIVQNAVDEWTKAGLRDLSDEMGSLITGDIPVARSVVAGAIHSAIEEKVEWDVGPVTPAVGGRLMADVDFSVSFEIDVLALKSSYTLSFVYSVLVEDEKVIDADLDLREFLLKRE